LEIISDVGLLLRNTDRLQQVEDYVRGCTTSTKTLTAFNKLKTMSEVVLLLPNSYRIKQVEDYVRDCHHVLSQPVQPTVWSGSVETFKATFSQSTTNSWNL
jgi:hypothetical protein